MIEMIMVESEGIPEQVREWRTDVIAEIADEPGLADRVPPFRHLGHQEPLGPGPDVPAVTLSTNLGFPRIGPERELKWALEDFWRGEIDDADLRRRAREVRLKSWRHQAALGVDHIPSNDFSLYDHVLDTAAMVGAVPDRYGWKGHGPVDLDTYFAMARGSREEGSGDSVPAMEMTKWYDTNYHYIVPEFWAGQSFRLASTRPIDEFVEAREAGIHTRPVLLGPVSFLLLGKSPDDTVRPLDLLERVVPVYEEVLQRLAGAGADWIQMDEPHLVLDLHPGAAEAYRKAYHRLARAVPSLNLLLATYFGELRENLELAASLPVEALHLDLVGSPEQLERALDLLPEPMTLSLGLVDGRNVWRTDLDAALEPLRRAVAALGQDRVFVGPSSSLLHVPVDLEAEPGLDPELRSWLAFARQKLGEIVALARAVSSGEEAIAEALAESRGARDGRKRSERVHDPAVRERLDRTDASMLHRQSPFPERRPLQRDRLDLPRYPTTTIGSFPQTAGLRKTRAAHRRGDLERSAYEGVLEDTIAETLRRQEELGLDVLVHGEPERNDMVQYFGEQLQGFAFTERGWVQSYGSRCVRPPVIYGDVARPKPMTVRWITYAQSRTDRPVKGILTGPVTMLQWSFVRDDQPRRETCRQIALAIRDEVRDLEEAGIGVIQVDEPALREGLPLRRDRWDEYLGWAVDAFRLATSGVRNETQIHTHMCYSEFNDIIGAIAALDADVLSIEAVRSRMELLDAFTDHDYPNDIGPGVYDIHSPRLPPVDEMVELLEAARERLSPDQIWVNPDCGLKTRSWDEVGPALANMVAAARKLRERETGPFS